MNIDECLCFTTEYRLEYGIRNTEYIAKPFLSMCVHGSLTYYLLLQIDLGAWANRLRIAPEQYQ